MWEHRVETFMWGDPQQLAVSSQEILSSLEVEGWELVQVVVISQYAWLFIKRERKEEDARTRTGSKPVSDAIPYGGPIKQLDGGVRIKNQNK